MSAHLVLENISKIFGANVEAGLEAIRQGKSKSELYFLVLGWIGARMEIRESPLNTSNSIELEL